MLGGITQPLPARKKEEMFDESRSFASVVHFNFRRGIECIGTIHQRSKPCSSRPHSLLVAFQFDGSGPTIDVGNRSRLNTSTFTISAFVKFNALSHPPGTNGSRPAGDMSIVDKISNTAVTMRMDGAW